jgi:aconitate hydratase
MLELISSAYDRSKKRVAAAKKLFGKPLTLAEKILAGHLPALDGDTKGLKLERKTSYVGLRPDRVAMQDATAQMALLQFMPAPVHARRHGERGRALHRALRPPDHRA